MEIIDALLPKEENKTPQEKEQKKKEQNYQLKYLGGVKVGLKAVEGFTFIVAPPLYEKCRDYARTFLIFCDNKLDQVEQKFEANASPEVKKVVHKLSVVSHQASQVYEFLWSLVEIMTPFILEFISDVRAKGFQAAFSEMMMKYLPKIQVKLMAILSKLAMGNNPLFNMAGSIGGGISNSLNNTVSGMAQAGTSIIGNLPLNPLDPLQNKKET